MWPTSGNNVNQWSFNPAVYQNIPYEQVDWATLAQQWIKMKEVFPPSVSSNLPPPPAPQISKSNETQPTKPTPAAAETQPTDDVEGGEAPMDMDTKDDDVPSASVGVAAGTNWNQWSNWQSQWGWGWPGNAGTVPLGEKTPSIPSTVDSKVKSLSNDSNPVLNNYVSNIGTFPNNTGTSTSQVPGTFNYNSVAGGTIPPTLPKPGYWTTAGKESWDKANKVAKKHVSQKPIVEQFSFMDAAKKKKLPAWIREGLNKMEREKQKKMEQERMVQEKLMRDQMPKDEGFRNDTFAENTVVPVESPSVVEEAEVSSPSQYEPSRSPSIERTSRYASSSAALEDPNPIRKTKDQIMEESMLKVRRILTEFLLEATENEVMIIAKDELRKRKSASAQQIRKSNALTSLTGNLGLAVYDSDSESSASEKEKDDRGINSDEELEMIIEKKKRDFTLIEDQIEHEIGNQEFKERQMSQRDQEMDNGEDSNSSKSRVRDTNSHDASSRSHKEPSDIQADERSEKSSKSYSSSNSKQNGETSGSSSKNEVRSDKMKKKSRSSSSSSSESSVSGDSSSSDSHYSKKKRRRRSEKKKQVIEKDNKRSNHRSKSRSTSRSRYSRSNKRYTGRGSRDYKEESSERRRSRDRRKASGSRHRRSRSSSYRKDGRDSATSKYKDSRRRECSDSKRKRNRSSSRDSRHSHYKRR